MKEEKLENYVDLETVRAELNKASRIFQVRGWPIIDVTRKSVEETAASIIKIYEITKKNA